MSTLFVWKEQLQKIYAKHSRYIDKAIQFILALSAFVLINSNVGFMKPAAKPIVAVALAAVCTFLPLVLTIVVSAVLVILHMYVLSMGVAIVTAGIFLVMFIFYFRLTPKKAIIVLLTPLAFMLKIPVVIPIVYGLIGTPMCIVPVACGTIVFYMLQYVKSFTTTITGAEAEGFVGQMVVFAQQVFKNKEMWIAVLAVVFCLLVVYTIRRQSLSYAWKVSIVVGAVFYAVIMAVGDISFDVHVSYTTLLIGSIISALIAIVLEFFVFAVDYSRTERLQYEDDEYYYYVKAVPKISVSAPEKTVKRINERQETAAPAQKVNEKQSTQQEQAPVKRTARKPEQDRPAGARPQQNRPVKKGTPPAKRRPAPNGKVPKAKAPKEQVPKVSSNTLTIGQTEELLLAKSLREEFDIQRILDEEAKKEES